MLVFIRPYSDDKTRQKIDELREKGLSLASIILRIKNKSFDGMHYKLSLREQIAKDLIERIRERVTDLDPSTETGVANTVVPNFDINYFNFYDHFIKSPPEDDSPLEGRKEKSSNTSNEISKSVKNFIVSLAQPFRLAPMISEGNVRVGLNEEKPMATKLMLHEDMMKADIEDSPDLKHASPTDHADQMDIENMMNKNVDQLTSPEDSPTDVHYQIRINQHTELNNQIKVNQHIELKAEPHKQEKKPEKDPLEFSSLREIRKRHLGARYTISDPEHAMQEALKASFLKPKVQLPKMLIRLRSNEDISLNEADTERLSLDKRRKLSCTTFIKPPQSVKSGLHFTTNSIGILFRLNKTMGKHKKLANINEIDIHINRLKKVFGLHQVQTSLLEIKNQSLSNLCKQ
jgi:DNA-binding transcriptional MerR regulator